MSEEDKIPLNGDTKAIMARFDERQKNTERMVKEIKDKLDNNYVTQDEFRPIRLLVYGFVGLMLSTLLISMIALVTR